MKFFRPNIRKTVSKRGLRLAVIVAIFAGASITIGNAAVMAVRRPLPVLLSGPQIVERPIVWIAPPPPRIVIAPTPRPGWIWSPGYWRWTGQTYIWRQGMWLQQRPGFVFTPAHWERFPGGWHFVPGGWYPRSL